MVPVAELKSGDQQHWDGLYSHGLALKERKTLQLAYLLGTKYQPLILWIKDIFLKPFWMNQTPSGCLIMRFEPEGI
jgi:hypothetical protein